MKFVSSIIGVALDCRDPDELADFYVELLGLEKTISSGNWAGIHTPQGIILAFQRVEEYVPPVWPWQEGEQQQMLHLDFKVDDLEKAVEHATKCGAKKAEVQYYDSSTVMFDPAGHPFCLSTVE
ncbi:MAG: VOC family protein [Firmicutes bacterium]|jgi:catechol 2,3-dioxygenase-like lactoylglutathione lyase family enzyme|nr:VOC family protein [Bacillota bacterium]NLO66506.1 VOC family protein [Bacillota bacterium]